MCSSIPCWGSRHSKRLAIWTKCMIDFDSCITLSFSGSRTHYFSFVTSLLFADVLHFFVGAICESCQHIYLFGISCYLQDIINWLCCVSVLTCVWIIFNVCVHVKGRKIMLFMSGLFWKRCKLFNVPFMQQEDECFLEVGDNNDIREHTSIHRSSKSTDRTVRSNFLQ